MKNIGISLCIEQEDYDIWGSGVRQNIFFLAKTLRAAGMYNVYIVNMNAKVPITSKLSWDLTRFNTVNFVDVKDILNVFILMGSSILDDEATYLKKRGCRMVYYPCGNRYVLDMEDILFNNGNTPVWNESVVDEIWMIPQHVNSCRDYMGILNRRPVYEVPFVWSSEFVDKIACALPNQAVWQHREGPKRISCFEPNLNVVKFCLYDMLLAEEAYRLRPDLIKRLYVTNAMTLKERKRFVSIALRLDIVKNGIAMFEGRFRMPFFLEKYTDVVVSHQWENALNYAYLDALYLKYPLVHNAPLIKDAGYYYPEFDAKEGARQLILAAEQHATNVVGYESRSQAVLSRYRFDNPGTLETYNRMLTKLMS